MSRGLVKGSLLLLAFFAFTVSVDISPKAYEMLLERGQGANSAWISDVYYT